MHTTSVNQAAGSDGATRPKGGPVIEIDYVTKRFGDYVVCLAPDASLVLPAADLPTTEDLEEMLDDL